MVIFQLMGSTIYSFGFDMHKFMCPLVLACTQQLYDEHITVATEPVFLKKQWGTDEFKTPQADGDSHFGQENRDPRHTKR